MLAASLLQRSHRLIRFLVSGVSATLIHWAGMAALLALGTHASMATASGAAIGATANYVMQRRFTFHSSARHRDLIPLYIAAVALGWVVNLLVFSVLHDAVHLTIPLAQVSTSLAVAFMNYWIFKRIVFQ